MRPSQLASIVPSGQNYWCALYGDSMTPDGSSNDNVSRLCVDLAKSFDYDPVVTLSPNGSSDEAYFDIFPSDRWKIVCSLDEEDLAFALKACKERIQL